MPKYHHHDDHHSHKSTECHQHAIYCLPYTICEGGKYIVNCSLTSHCDKAIIVNASNVCIKFCCDAKISLNNQDAIGICIGSVENVKINNASICGIDNKNQTAISVNGSCNVDIYDGKFKNLEEVVHVGDGSGDVLVKDSSIKNCSYGVQVLRGSTVSNIVVKNNVGTHTKTWTMVEMNGICTNCSVIGNNSTYGKIWCWQCQNCSIRENKVHFPTINGKLNFSFLIIGCGGWRPSAFPAPQTMPNSEKFGCLSCQIVRNQISVKEYIQQNSITFVLGIICQFCGGCTVDDNSLDLNDPQGAAASKGYGTLGIISSYCESCTYNRDHVTRCAMCFFICDIWDDGLFCKNSSLYDCTACNCFYGFVGQRCEGIFWKNCTATSGHVGWYISEGAIGSTVDNCYGVKMSHAGVWNLRSTGGGIEQLITDPFLAPPVKTIVRNSVFVVTNNGIYSGDVGGQAGDGTPYGDLDNNMVIV